MNTNRTAEVVAAEIRLVQWEMEVHIPSEIKATTHARRLASLRRQQAELPVTLSQLVTEYGSLLQEA